jgi:hypothetical protein
MSLSKKVGAVYPYPPTPFPASGERGRNTGTQTVFKVSPRKRREI